jgi:hypothetical protein
MGSLHLKFMDAATSLVITKVLTLDNFCSSVKITENLHHTHTHTYGLFSVSVDVPVAFCTRQFGWE